MSEEKAEEAAPKGEPAETKDEPAKADEPRQLSSREAAMVIGISLAAGVAFFFAGRLSVPPPDEGKIATPAMSMRPFQRPLPPPPPAGSVADGIPVPPLNGFPEVSFAQQGEDIIIKDIFGALDIAEATYLDIGAHDPIRGSNSFLFYALGSKGVLVEPNPELVAKLKRVRPRDVVIDKGIGVTADKTAKYYEFGGDGQLNTFSADQVAKLAKANLQPKKVVDMPLIDINDVLAQNFPKEAPNLLSIDTEGLDLAILQKIDFTRFRPQVICAETQEPASYKPIPEIAAFLATKHYTARGGTLENTIFVADEAVAKAKPPNEKAP